MLPSVIVIVVSMVIALAFGGVGGSAMVVDFHVESTCKPYSVGLSLSQCRLRYEFLRPGKIISKTQSNEPSDTPTQAPTQCKDDDDFKFKINHGNTKKPCSWLTRNRHIKREEYPATASQAWRFLQNV